MAITTLGKGTKNKLIKAQADSLVVHPYAQRDIIPAKLKRLMANLDLDAIGMIHAVEYEIPGRGEHLWVIDGQHRVRALLDHGFGEWPVDVMLHASVKDDARAAKLFIELNDRAAVSAYDKFRNELTAKDDEAVAIYDIARKYGLKISAQSGDGCIAGIASVRNAYRIDEGAALDKACMTSTQAWGKKPAALEGKTIHGLSLVYGRYNSSVELSTMVQKLAKYSGGAPGLIGDARGLMEYRKVSLARCIAERAIETYNAGRRIGRLDPL